MRRWLAPILAAAATCLAVPGVAAADPTVVLAPKCSIAADGSQNYDVTFGVTGFPPSTTFSGDIEFQEIQPDGSLKPSFGASAEVTTEADGSWISSLGVEDTPTVATLTINSDLLPGGTETKSVSAACERPPSQPAPVAAKRRPTLVKQCRHGGYRRFAFKSQRRCVAYVRRGPRAR
jgi:hypothetical protein